MHSASAGNPRHLNVRCQAALHSDCRATSAMAQGRAQTPLELGLDSFDRNCGTLEFAFVRYALKIRRGRLQIISCQVVSRVVVTFVLGLPSAMVAPNGRPGRARPVDTARDR